MSQSQLSAVYIVSAARTPIGAFLGSLSSQSAPRLGAVAMGGALKQAHVDPHMVDEVFMGSVLTGGQGQAPARQAMIYADIPATTAATTVGKVCGSGMQAVIFAARALALGDISVAIAGGMESMSNAPHYLEKARSGYRLGDGKLVDGMIYDGLWDPYKNVHMGNCGDLCAAEYRFSRQEQDRYAAESFRRAQEAQKAGAFNSEIEPVHIPQKNGDKLSVLQDEGPSKGGDLNKMSNLRPAFSKDGTITAANASSINDGASALLLMNDSGLKRSGAKPLARITGYASAAHEPEWFTTAPAKAMKALMEKQKKTFDQIDLFEINEAFAVVAMVCAKLCEISLDKVNLRGGAVALGHPIGASGARIITTLVHAMKDTNKKQGMASICIGGGEALALSVELC